MSTVLDRDELIAALADLPVFPLPDLVFFPDTLLPLHIFEPRYRAMTRHCLESHKLMAVARLLRGPGDAHNNPPFAAIAGVGRIVEHEMLPDGRYNLLLQGVARAQLHELPFTPPFRRARAELLEDTAEPATSRDLQALLSLVAVYTAELRARNSAFELQLPQAPLGELLNHVAAGLIVDPTARQRILEEHSPRNRCTQILAEVAAQQARLAGRVPARDAN